MPRTYKKLDSSRVEIGKWEAQLGRVGKRKTTYSGDFEVLWRKYLSTIVWDGRVKQSGGGFHFYKRMKCADCNTEMWVDGPNLKRQLQREYDRSGFVDQCTFRCLKCRYRYYVGKRNVNWTGGKMIHGDGYILLHKDLIEEEYQPMICKKKCYVFEHRYVMAKSLGRCLSDQEVVHHINGDKKDNRIKNLELVSPIQHWATTKVKFRLEKRIRDLEKENLELKKQLCLSAEKL